MSFQQSPLWRVDVCPMTTQRQSAPNLTEVYTNVMEEGDMCAVRWTITTTVDVRIDNLLINTTYTQIKHKGGQLSKKGCDFQWQNLHEMAIRILKAP